MGSPIDRNIRENALNEAIRFFGDTDGRTAEEVVQAAAQFEEYVREGKKADDE